MPIIECTILEGRSEEQLKEFVEAITEVAVKKLNAVPEYVTVVLREMPKNRVAHAGIFADKPGNPVTDRKKQ